MLTKNEYTNKMWLYYLQLEKDFLETLNYIEFEPDNFPTYSKVYTKQLLSICSEFDVICKQLCQVVDNNANRSKITDYAEILSEYNHLSEAKVYCTYTNSEYSPLLNWTKDNSPTWWKDYNDVKHHRMENNNHKKSNFLNVFLALAGLYIVNRYLCKEVCSGKVMKEPEVPSNLFRMVGWDICISEGNGFVKVLRNNGNVGVMYDG